MMMEGTLLSSRCDLMMKALLLILLLPLPMLQAEGSARTSAKASDSASPFANSMAISKRPSLSKEGLFSLFHSGVSSTYRLKVSRFLETFEKQFLRLTGFSRGDAPPVVVILHSSVEKTSGLPLLRVDVMEGGATRVCLDLIEGRDGESQVHRMIATALLLREYYGSSTPTPGARIPRYPSWATSGLGHLCAPDASSVAIPAGYLHGGAPPEIEAFLSQRPPDESDQTFSSLYDAMASSLLKSGLQGGGDQAFRDWVTQHDSGDKSSSSIPVWPPGWQMRPVERRWLLLMPGDQEKESRTTTLMSIAESLTAYDAIISSVQTTDHSIGLLRKEKGSDYLIEQFSSRVAALRFRANPMVLPLIDGTTLLVNNLKRMPEKKVVSAEADLRALRALIGKQSREIEHYLDWFEAARLPVPSGLFENYLKSPESTIRKGPVGRYLDAIEARGW